MVLASFALKTDITLPDLMTLYGQPLIHYEFEGEDIFVISDLHLGAGRRDDGNYTGNENFFADQSFARFIGRLTVKDSGNKKLLVINGDLVDFLRITDIPETKEAIEKWQQLLQSVGINKSLDELKNSISSKERKYGLKTNDYKSIWKLYVCAQGHSLFFASLGQWLSLGHQLVITKGNHDLEWFWPTVRDYMALLLAEKVTIALNLKSNVLNDIVRPNLLFVDDKIIINNKLYIEHGHRYEHFTAVDGPPVLKDQNELNLPFGSFFNRYLINRVELAYPYIEDVRPRENILPVLIRERFPLAVKILFNYVPFSLMVIPKRQYAFAFRYLLHFILFIVLPIALVVVAFLYFNPVKIDFSTPKGILGMLFPTIENVAFLILSYFIGRLFAMLKLSSPYSLYNNAERAMDNYPETTIATFGHTHNPEQKASPTRRYFNTGTWIPVVETDAADVRLDRTYTFLWLTRNRQGDFEETNLMRWNDDAERADALILMDRS